MRNTRLCVRLPFGFGDKSTGRAATGQGQDEFRQKTAPKEVLFFIAESLAGSPLAPSVTIRAENRKQPDG